MTIHRFPDGRIHDDPALDPRAAVESAFAPPAASSSADDAAWPILDSAALHGPAGDYVRACNAHTESDPAHRLAAHLVTFGGAVGAGPHMVAGNVQHPACLFALLIGRTAKARKGTAVAVNRRAIERADRDYIDKRSMSGWGSGEAVIKALADGTDQRLLIAEPEYARVLNVAARDKNILSSVIRQAWDGLPLQTRSITNTAVAKEHHVAVLGEITVDELRSLLTALEQANGFANRHLHVLGQRVQRLPAGGNVPEQALAAYGKLLAQRLEHARTAGQVHRTAAAEARWAEIYDELADDDPPGLLGAILARSDAQVLRLSLTYALLDGARAVDVAHIDAALALWHYCRDSAAYLFGIRTGSPDADRLLDALRAAPDGLDRTGQFNVFGRNIDKRNLAVARELLVRQGRANESREESGGRTREVLRSTNTN
jgi:hypothetical protein